MAGPLIRTASLSQCDMKKIVENVLKLGKNSKLTFRQGTSPQFLGNLWKNQKLVSD